MQEIISDVILQDFYVDADGFTQRNSQELWSTRWTVSVSQRTQVDVTEVIHVKPPKESNSSKQSMDSRIHLLIGRGQRASSRGYPQQRGSRRLGLHAPLAVPMPLVGSSDCENTAEMRSAEVRPSCERAARQGRTGSSDKCLLVADGFPIVRQPWMCTCPKMT
eukprot:4002903-Amphidinium_carterae.1